MNFGKAAYTKVLELERKLGTSENGLASIGVYESATIEKLSVTAGNYTVDFGSIEQTADGICVMIKGEILAESAADITFSLFCAGEKVSGKVFDGVLGQSYFDITKVVSGGAGKVVSVVLEIQSSCDFVIERMSMFCINGKGEDASSEGDIELKAVKTPDETFVISYVNNSQIFACEVDTKATLEMNFLKIMDGVISHAFAFDKSGNFLLFFVTTSGDLFLRKIGSGENDTKISENCSCVSAVLAPENVSADVLISCIQGGGKKVVYFWIKDGVISGLQDLSLPAGKVFCDLALVSAENFAYVVVTSSLSENYILKSAFEPLSGVVFDRLECGYVLTTKKYNTVLEENSGVAEQIVAAYEFSAAAAKNFGKMLEELCVSHLKGNYEILPEVYEAAPAGIHYTVVIDKLNSDPDARCTYADDAEGFLPMRNTANEESGYNDKLEDNGWLSRWPFSHIKPCALQDGKFLGYLDTNDYGFFESGQAVGSDSNKNYVDVMIEIPKIYYCIETIDDKIYVRISNQKLDDRFKCYAHVYDGIELDKIYVGAYSSIPKTYNGASTLFSASGYMINVTDLCFDTYESYLTNKSDKYRILTFDQYTLIQCLFLIAVKSTNSHTSYARGMNGSARALTGTGDTWGMYYGDTGRTRTLKFLGLENIFANVAERVEGIAIRSLPDYSTYSLLRRDPYSKVAINKKGNGYSVLLTNPALDSVQATNQFLVNPYGTTEAGFLPQSRYLDDGTKATATTYFCDAVDFYTGYGIYMGGSFSQSTRTGVFSFYSERGTKVSGNWGGFRLVYYPTGGNG